MAIRPVSFAEVSERSAPPPVRERLERMRPAAGQAALSEDGLTYPYALVRFANPDGLPVRFRREEGGRPR